MTEKKEIMNWSLVSVALTIYMYMYFLFLFNSSLAVGAIFSLKSSTARNNSDKLQILNLRDKVNRIGK